MSDPISAIIVAAALTTVVERLVDTLGSSLGAFKKRWSDTVHKGLASLEDRAKAIGRVKTILDPENPSDLRRIFYPPTVQLDPKVNVRVSELGDLPFFKVAALVAPVGRGKSILLRHICVREYSVGHCIPVFVELRRVATAGSVSSLILDELEALGLPTPPDALDRLYTTGSFHLLLDGFDEVPVALQAQTVEEILRLHRKHDTLRILVATRPESAFCYCAEASIFRLRDLEPEAWTNVVRRICSPSDAAEEIIRNVESPDAMGLKSVLVSPLLVALLVVRFRLTGSVPESAHAFYTQLFELLVERHDRFKPCFTRSRLTRVGDATLEHLFDTMSFVARQRDRAVFNRPEILDTAQTATTTLNVREDAASIVADIRDITSLLVEEAGEYSWLHRSIQEYHAAQFIRRQNDGFALEFYRLAVGAPGQWAGVVSFLRVCDSERLAEFLSIPLLRRFLGCGDDASGECGPREILLHWFSDVTVTVYLGMQGHGLSWSDPTARRFLRLIEDDEFPDTVTRLGLLVQAPLGQSSLRKHVAKLPEAKTQGSTKRRRRSEAGAAVPHHTKVPLGVLLKDDRFWDAAKPRADAFVRHFRLRLQSAEEVVFAARSRVKLLR